MKRIIAINIFFVASLIAIGVATDYFIKEEFVHFLLALIVTLCFTYPLIIMLYNEIFYIVRDRIKTLQK